jgi:hypothetical protein
VTEGTGVMAKKRTIKAKELIKDIRGGMSDFELTKKYGLTEQEFDRVINFLVDAGLVTKRQLEERRQLSESQIIRAFVESCEDIRVVD